MKRIMFMLSCTIFLFGFAACGKTETVLENTVTNTQQDSTENFSQSEKSDISTQKQNPTEKQTVTERQLSPERNYDAENQKLGEKLLKEFKNKTVSEITIFNDRAISYMGYESLEDLNKRYQDIVPGKYYETGKPVDVITDKKEIEEFIKSLKIEKWKADRCTTLSLPNTFIYFGNDMLINLESTLGGNSWISINSPTGHATFLVPNDVYNALFAKYSK